MSQSYWAYWFVLFGVAIVGVMIGVQQLTTTSSQNYYAIKEIAEESMIEAVDYSYYREYNELKINKEKFMEVFIRKLPERLGTNRTYDVSFYGIYEAPPKVSVEVKTNSGSTFTASKNYDVIERVDAILQYYGETEE